MLTRPEPIFFSDGTGKSRALPPVCRVIRIGLYGCRGGASTVMTMLARLFALLLDRQIGPRKPP